MYCPLCGSVLTHTNPKKEVEEPLDELILTELCRRGQRCLQGSIKDMLERKLKNRDFEDVFKSLEELKFIKTIKSPSGKDTYHEITFEGKDHIEEIEAAKSAERMEQEEDEVLREEYDCPNCYVIWYCHDPYHGIDSAPGDNWSLSTVK